MTPVSSRSASGSRQRSGSCVPRRRGLVVLDQRDAGVAQRVDAGGDRQLRVAPERREAVGVDAELLAEVERAGARRQLDDVGGVVDRLEASPLPSSPLTRRVMCLSSDLAAQARGDHVDELLAVAAGARGCRRRRAARCRAARARRR